MSETSKPQRVAIAGATGYIGGRLVPQLLDSGYSVRCLARSPGKLQAREWAKDSRVEIVGADLADAESLASNLEGCQAAFYLVHSMTSAGADYAEQDSRLASIFAGASRKAGVERIIYLGGLGETGADLSAHLSSRRQVEDALASTGVPVTVIRAAMIIGSGSASFEILDLLVGGPGLRRGRRDPETVGYGEALDFWRVVSIERDRKLALRAEMKLPGEAQVEFLIELQGKTQCSLQQRALFHPRGLFGLLYWYAVAPLHHIVFRGMLSGIQREALKNS